MKQCVLFAGVGGSGKSPIAVYLSYKLNLPIFSNDVIRTEVHEDTLAAELEVPEFERRRHDRLEALIRGGQSFILDASIDRRWPELKPKLEDAGYENFIIDITLSEPFLTRLFNSKLGKFDAGMLRRHIKEHEKFLADFNDHVNFKITDENYSTRLTDSLEAVTAWLK